MSQLIDQPQKRKNHNNPKIKRLSLGLIVIVALLIAFTLFQLVKTKSSLDSPLLPDYTIWWMNAGLVNFTTICTAGLVPGLYFHWRKNYIFSVYVLLLFFIAGLILKNYLNAHLWFVGLF
jgi:hypothetical protein